MYCWSDGSVPGSALRLRIPVKSRMENELCGALTSIHIEGEGGIEKSFVLYRAPSELPSKIAKDQGTRHHRHDLHLSIQ